MPQASPATIASPARSVPRWTSIVATGPRPTSSRDSMIGPEASAFGFAFSSSSASATSSTFSSRSSRFCFSLAETSEYCVDPPHSSGWRSSLTSSWRTRCGVGAGLVDLVHRDDDRHLGRAGVGDRLLRLRLDAVVGRDDEHRDVGHVRAAGAHGGEGLVARRVEERDLAAVVLGLVRADVLGDSAGLGLDDGGLADRVEQRRLAVVDVAHDRDHRRPRDEILLGVLVDLRELVLLGDVLDGDLALDLGGDQLHGLVRERLRDRDHLAEAHHDLDDLGRRHAERLGQVLDGHAGRDRDRAGRRGAGPDFGRGSVRSRAWRESWRGRAAPLSMTTRRFRPPGAWRGRTGLFGRFPFEFPFESAISVPTSVEASERLIDPDGRLQRAGEAAVGDRALEALEPAARVHASPGLLRAGRQRALAGDEADELFLRRLPAAAGAGPDRAPGSRGRPVFLLGRSLPRPRPEPRARREPPAAPRARLRVFHRSLGDRLLDGSLLGHDRRLGGDLLLQPRLRRRAPPRILGRSLLLPRR